MSMWRVFKYGIAFHASRDAWRWITKIIGFVALVIGAGVGLPFVADSVGTYNQVRQKYEHQAHQAKAGHQVEKKEAAK